MTLKASPPMSKARSIPSLDGLRALAVLSVILFHCESLDRYRWLQPLRNGSLGVTCFFVISGLLITKLLLAELDRNTRIDLLAFYLRRAFRIFPPFYLYLLAVLLLGLFSSVPFGWKSFFYAATYLKNYFPHPTVLFLSHTWSLALEEQFYLLWPACLFFVRPRTCLRIAAIAILASPLLRVLTYALVPSMRDHINYMLHTRLDAIMVGAFLALAGHQRVFVKPLEALAKPIWLFPAALYFLVQPALTNRFAGAFTLPVGFSLDALACGLVIHSATTLPTSALGRFLNLRALRHLGIISYSLYLWQQLFTGPHALRFPLNLVPVFVAAEASYWLLERPSLTLRNRLLRSKQLLPDAVEREDALAVSAV